MYDYRGDYTKYDYYDIVEFNIGDLGWYNDLYAHDYGFTPTPRLILILSSLEPDGTYKVMFFNSQHITFISKEFVESL